MKQKKYKKYDLEQREKELQERERKIILQELELEINKKSPPLYNTEKYNSLEKQNKFQLKKLLKIGKFLGIVVGVVAAVYIGFWVAKAVLVVGVAWVGYEIIFGQDNSDN
ncbi:MAG: hypothetical protein F6K54_33645 [Okeania sp. SIO3B5]|uniref:hypothetical protein n=1 Tax=Okeania sp. SIO3B5 TaxID=2607811 RepID=UPI0014019F9A|nr:hypothetical protein [Okeania sp. SIO3B5]NEO57583.1 hypothetical protein [Okeania sp. SIO3B5]